MQYRKRLVTVEARQLTTQNGDELAQWCGGRFECLRDRGVFDSAKSLIFPSLAGTMHAYVGNYIVKGANGNFWAIAAENFIEDFEVDA